MSAFAHGIALGLGFWLSLLIIPMIILIMISFRKHKATWCECFDYITACEEREEYEEAHKFRNLMKTFPVRKKILLPKGYKLRKKLSLKKKASDLDDDPFNIDFTEKRWIEKVDL